MKFRYWILLSFLLVVGQFSLAVVSVVGGSFPDTINRGLVCYGVDLDIIQRQWVGSNFDLVDMNFGYNGDAEIMHNFNDELIVLGYRDLVYARESPIIPDWSTILSNPSWFMKDNGGNFIYSSYWGCYVMNISNVDYQQHVIDWLDDQFIDGGYDGVFCDDVWYYPEWYESGWNSSLTTESFDNWHDDMIGFLQHLNLDLTQLVIINSDELWSDEYIDHVDGQMMEYFGHNSVASNIWNDYYNLGDDLARKSALGKIVFAYSTYVPYTPAYDDECVNVCYDLFVDNCNDFLNSYWGMNTYTSSDGNKGYYSVMGLEVDVDITDYSTATPVPSATDSGTYPTVVNHTEGWFVGSVGGIAFVIVIILILVIPFWKLKLGGKSD